jgi:zinc transport system permease protein
MMVLASLLNMSFTLCGLWLAYRYNLTSGAAIILVAGAGFFLTLVLDLLGIRRRPVTVNNAD